MTINASLHTKVEISDWEAKRIAIEYLESLFDVPLRKDVRPDSLLVDNNGNLVKFEDLRGGIEKTIIRKATELDFALSKVLEELRLRD